MITVLFSVGCQWLSLPLMKISLEFFVGFLLDVEIAISPCWWFALLFFRGGTPLPFTALAYNCCGCSMYQSLVVAGFLVDYVWGSYFLNFRRYKMLLGASSLIFIVCSISRNSFFSRDDFNILSQFTISALFFAIVLPQILTTSSIIELEPTST